MKKLILAGLTTTLLLSGVAYAQDGGNIGSKPTPKIAPVMKDLRPEKIDLKMKLSTSTASTTKGVLKMIRKQIDKRLQNMLDRFEATIEREESIITKINSRIEKIKLIGGKTTDAEKSIADAQTLLDKAKALLLELQTSMQNATNNASTTPTTKENLTQWKKMTQDIEKNIRDAHKLLEKSVGQLRGVSQLKNASSTKEATNQN